MTNVFSNHVKSLTPPPSAAQSHYAYSALTSSPQSGSDCSSIPTKRRKRKRRYQVVNAALVEANNKKSRFPRSTKTLAQLGLALSVGTACMIEPASAETVFINEFHYDNIGTDTNEGLEIAAAAGTNLDNWELLFYNGGDGKVYKNRTLSGLVPDLSDGYGVLSVSVSGIQNGPADGFALVNPFGDVIDFISYEGTIVATEGAAAGLSSWDIGLSELTSSPLGKSIQRWGNGITRDDFAWQIETASFGAINPAQSFKVTSVPLPASLWLFTCACAVLLAKKRSAISAEPASVYLKPLTS